MGSKINSLKEKFDFLPSTSSKKEINNRKFNK
jgi:hypothetical protein